MDTNVMDGMLLKHYEQFKDLTKNHEEFLQQNSSASEEFLNVSKSLHDYIIQSNSLTALKSKSLPMLLINGFDDEQILQQLEIQNKSAFSHINAKISKLDLETLAFNLFNINNSSENYDYNDDHSVADEEAMDASESEEHDFDENHSSDDDYEDNIELNNVESKASEKKKKKVQEDGMESDLEDGMESDLEDGMESDLEDGMESDLEDGMESDLEDGMESDKEQKKKKGASFKRKTEVDDQFFKLSELEHFLRLEDLKEERARDGKLDEDDDDEEIDLFQDVVSDCNLDESDGEDENVTKKSSKDLMYEDFFDAPDSGDDEKVESSKEMSDLENEIDHDKNYAREDENEEDNELQEDKTEVPIKKTPYELQQENINKKISEFENSMIRPKPWHLTGEVDVSDRPKNALLDLPTDFQMNVKPAIIQDKEFCEKIENLIKMTKKNKAYCDGVRKQKPDKEVIANKKEIVLDQNKSKKGLAEEYEDMYLKKQKNQEEKENPKHKEIKKFMDSLFPQLYALFSHIPKPAVPEIKIVSNLPAITVEEVAPTSYSDIALLAPEEVKKRTGVIKGHTERTDTDRKRERRRKKLYQKMKQKEKEKEDSSGKPLSRKVKNQEKLDILKKLKQNRQTKIANMGEDKIKSSKDFFERLQETVTSAVSRKELKLQKKI